MNTNEVDRGHRERRSEDRIAKQIYEGRKNEWVKKKRKGVKKLSLTGVAKILEKGRGEKLKEQKAACEETVRGCSGSHDNLQGRQNMKNSK